MVKDLKGYREKGDGRIGSPGWLILVVSHVAVLLVGLFLGYWVGDRFASVSSAHKTLSREVQSEKDAGSELAADKGKELPPEAVSKRERKKLPASSPEQPKKEPEFTFFESLQKEEIPTAGAETKVGEAKKTEVPGSEGSEIRKRSGKPARKLSSRVYYVQVSSFREESKARDLAERLRGRGYPARVVPGVINDRGIWYRVRMGPFGNKSEADERVTAVKKIEKVEPFILHEKREKGS